MNKIVAVASAAAFAFSASLAWGQAAPQPATPPKQPAAPAAAAADLKECKLHNHALREALIREYNKAKKDNPYRVRSVFQTDFNHSDAEIQKLRNNKNMTIEECNRISARLHKQAELLGREMTRPNEEAEKYDKVRNLGAFTRGIQAEWKTPMGNPMELACTMLQGVEKMACMRRLPFIH